MPSAAKHFDVVVGIDMHLVQPPGPTPPVPIPHPFVGVVFDPFDYLPLLEDAGLLGSLAAARPVLGGGMARPSWSRGSATRSSC